MLGMGTGRMHPKLVTMNTSEGYLGGGNLTQVKGTIKVYTVYFYIVSNFFP